MPKRSNDFQRLVFLIQEQLKDRPDTVVTESRMLTDRRSGKKREVDIVVECKPNGITYLLGFECTQERRKATIEWVERMIQKHAFLSDKLVLVARAGFCSDAVALTKSYGVETITLGNAVSLDWPALIDEYTRLFFFAFDFKVTECNTDCDAPAIMGPLADFPDGHDMTLVDICGLARPFNAAVNSMLKDHFLFGRNAMDFWYNLPLGERRNQHEVSFEFTPSIQERPAVVVERMLYRVKRIYGKASMHVVQIDVSLGPNQYKDLRVMHGTARLNSGLLSGRTLHLVLGERQGERPKGTIMLASDASGAQSYIRTLELETPQRDG